jgi:hypothetical protein
MKRQKAPGLHKLHLSRKAPFRLVCFVHLRCVPLTQQGNNFSSMDVVSCSYMSRHIQQLSMGPTALHCIIQCTSCDAHCMVHSRMIMRPCPRLTYRRIAVRPIKRIAYTEVPH